MEMVRRPSPLFVCALVLGSALAPGCRSAPAGNAPEGAAAAEKADATALDLLGLDVAIAELELEQTKFEAAAKRGEAEVAARMAEKTQEQARKALEGFRSRKKALQVDEATLEISVSRGGVADATAELGELEAMYAAEEFAQTTKELVLARGRRNLEHARARLDLRERKLVELTELDLPKQEQELVRALEEAEVKASQARDKRHGVELEAEISVRKAEKALREARKKLDEAQEKAEESK